jgi:ubiquinone/menaquinone biosynthesis C-methylase UbiE
MLFPMLLLFFANGAAAQSSREHVERMHQDSKAYIEILERPDRNAEQKPDEVIKELGIKPGEIIADIGAGSGYFAFRFARHVGNTGRVYAVDIESDMILFMNRRIRDMKIGNVVTVLAAPDDPLLMDSSIDRFFICNTWHHIKDRGRYLERIKRMLEPGGQVIVIDYHKREMPVGPPMEMRLAREDVLREMESNGFDLLKEHRFLPYQYFLVFMKR